MLSVYTYSKVSAALGRVLADHRAGWAIQIGHVNVAGGGAYYGAVSVDQFEGETVVALKIRHDVGVVGSAGHDESATCTLHVHHGAVRVMGA